ncbi:MAG: hypothetical protein WCG06_02675, partial [Candidatus Omnitrophota bacterium]
AKQDDGTQTLIGEIVMTRAFMDQARAENARQKEIVTKSVLEEQVLPSLEAFSDRQRLMRDAKRAFVKSTSPVILRVAIDREGKRWTNGQLQNTLLEIEEVKTFLKDQNDRDNIKIQLVSLDGKTLYGDLSDPVEEGMLQDPNVHIMYVGTFDDTLFDVALRLNGKAGYLASQALVNTDKESSSLLCAPAMVAAISMARTTPKSFESGSALDRILSSLIGASYAIGQRQDNYKTLYEITSPDQKQKNLNLLVRIVRLPINQYLAYTSLLIKAVGAAA